MDIREESLKLHYDWNGKIEVISRVPISSCPALQSLVWRCRRISTKAMS